MYVVIPNNSATSHSMIVMSMILFLLIHAATLFGFRAHETTIAVPSINAVILGIT